MNKTILIADDDQSIISIFDFILRQAQYETITATNGKECLEIIDKKKIDLVFLDIKMPVLSGLETLKVIKEKHPKQMTILMTGYTINTIIKEGLDLGAYGVIYKPFDIEEILSIVRETFQSIQTITT